MVDHNRIDRPRLPRRRRSWRRVRLYLACLLCWFMLAFCSLKAVAGDPDFAPLTAVFGVLAGLYLRDVLDLIGTEG